MPVWLQEERVAIQKVDFTFQGGTSSSISTVLMLNPAKMVFFLLFVFLSWIMRLYLHFPLTPSHGKIHPALYLQQSESITKTQIRVRTASLQWLERMSQESQIVRSWNQSTQLSQNATKMRRDDMPPALLSLVLQMQTAFRFWWLLISFPSRALVWIPTGF